MVCYVLLNWLFHEGLGFGLIEVAVGVSIALIAVLEITRYFWDDPFSTQSIIKYFLLAVGAIKKVLKAVGVRPKTNLYDLKQSQQVLQLKQYLAEKRWNEAENFLKEFDADDRYAIVDPLVDVDGRARFYDEWTTERSDSAIAWMVSGFQYIKWAWEARGDGTADTVTNVGYQQFFMRLDEAHQAFSKSIELDNKYADPYVGLMTVAMGTGWEREQLWDYFTKALVRSKNCYSAHSQMIHAVAEKWGGEPGEMFNIAYRAVGKAKDNIPLVGILAEAHIEQWLYLGMCERDAEAEIYFREEQVRQDLLDVYQKIRNADADSFYMLQALNNFAFCFYMAGMNELAKEIVIRLEGRFLEHPWDYLDETIMSIFDVGYTVDEVIKKLSVVTIDMPDVLVKEKQTTSQKTTGDTSSRH